MAMAPKLIDELDRAVALDCCQERCEAVKAVLHDCVLRQDLVLEERFLEPCCEKYARRLVHKDPEGRYSVVAMVWSRGQGTPLHDHDHRWCVECVYRGRIRVVSYSLTRESNGLSFFEKETEVYAGRGEAGALIPPFEYHTVENADIEPSVTVHVYAGEMTESAAYLPEGDGYRRVVRPLAYTS